MTATSAAFIPGRDVRRIVRLLEEMLVKLARARALTKHGVSAHVLGADVALVEAQTLVRRALLILAPPAAVSTPNVGARCAAERVDRP